MLYGDFSLFQFSGKRHKIRRTQIIAHQETPKMLTRKTTLLILSSVIAISAGCFIGTSMASTSFAKLNGTANNVYTAEINTSTNIIISSTTLFGFQLHGSENFGRFSGRVENCIEVHTSGDYVLTILPDENQDNFITFYLKESDSRSVKVGDEWKTLYAFPGMRSITVTLDNDVTNFSLHGYSGAASCFDASERVEGNLKMYTLTRNETPLPDSSWYGNHILLECLKGTGVAVNIRSISITYSCGN